MSGSKLNVYYNAPNEEDNLVIIPSGYVVPKPPEEVFDENAQLDRLKNDKISVILPYDNNIYNGKFSKTSWGSEITHSPKNRAEMIYEAVSAKNEDGSYKYNNIYFTGGSNTEDVIWELDKLCKEKGDLPQRKDSLKTYGFSDATQLHHYLGQRGISTPVYYSKNIYALVGDLTDKHDDVSSFELVPVNQSAKNVENLNGCLQPGNQTQVEDKMTHQTAFFEDKYNFVVAEFGSVDAAKAFCETSKNFESEKVALLLSKDTNEEAIKYLKDNSNFPIFSGMPVGHGECLRSGEAVSLFANAKLERNENACFLNVADKASDDVWGLKLSSRRSQKIAGSGEEKVAVLSCINGSSGAVFENFDKLQSGASDLSIKIPQSETDDIVQTMEMSAKKLFDKGIINSENLKNIKFECENFEPDEMTLKNMKIRMEDLGKRYFPNLDNLKFNDKSIFAPEEEKEKMKQRIHVLRKRCVPDRPNRGKNPAIGQNIANYASKKVYE